MSNKGSATARPSVFSVRFATSVCFAASSRFPALAVSLCSVGALLLAGCATYTAGGGGTAQPGTAAVKLSGVVHGGQQPVGGASIALYAAGKTAIASTPRSMLQLPVTTLADGSFSISGDYSCQPGDQVYIVATQGNAGSGTNNAIAMMTALGPCATLLANASTTFITINEVTTVASVYALQAFMTGVQNVGADPANANALAGAFANTQTMVNTATGTALQTSTGNGIVPYMEINTLADALASCVNSTLSDSGCSNLFSAASVGGSAPADTLQATVNVALNPANNVMGIYNLAAAKAPFQPTLGTTPAAWTVTVAHPSDVLTFHNDNTRDGVQAYETTLTPASVNPTGFGKKFSFPVDSYLFAQPLYVGGVGMPDGAVHNVLIAASTHATVYGFDADGNNPGSGSLWSVSLLPAGERYAQASDYGGCNNPPEAGITGTPVIDRASQTIYLVTKTIATGSSTVYTRLHALSLLDGTERPGSPQVIAPVFNGSGDGSSGGTIAFNSNTSLNRSALTLTTNTSGLKTVYVNFASSCDRTPYHGDVIGYSTTNLATPSQLFNDTPNGNDGGIWLGAGGLAADAASNLYMAAGNGTYDANTGGPDHGDSVVRLAPATGSATAMTAADDFTPSNQATLQQYDLDVGGSEALLINDTQSSYAPLLLVATDKNGYIYLLNAANLGGYSEGTHGVDGLNADLEDFRVSSSSILYSYSFFNNMLYTSTPVAAYAYTPGSSTTNGTLATTATATGSFGTGSPVISANGTANGIVWVQSTGGTVYALAPGTLTELWGSNQAANNRDQAATFVKFTAPVIANGKVYVSGQGAVTVYGLLP